MRPGAAERETPSQPGFSTGTGSDQQVGASDASADARGTGPTNAPAGQPGGSGTSPQAGGSNAPRTGGTANRSSTVPGEPRPAGSGTSPTTGPRVGSPRGLPESGAAPGGNGETRSPIKVGLVGTLSGPAGPNLAPHAQGTQLWAKWVNSRSGLNGHPVQLVVADNGGDPARHRALVQDLVENQHVLAFVGNIETVVGPSAVDYLNSKRIPVIGLQGGETHAYDSPMYFPQASAGQAYYDTMFASWAQQAIPKGKTKFAIVACVEAEVCQHIYDQSEAQTTRRGLALVYKARISLAQPDFTAECLGARNAGADLIFVLGDGNTQRRMAASCERQSYRPLFVSAAEAVNFDVKDDPRLNNGRLLLRAITIPFVADTPAAAEYQAAFKQFGTQLGPSAGLTIGWVSGKLFERAAAQIPEPPTTQAILSGLWSIKNDDLGGITQPLTFVQDQRPTPRNCWWNLIVEQGVWRSPDAFRRTCD